MFERDRKTQLANLATPVLLCLAAAKLAAHLLAIHRYGFFTDELYYIACSRHLDWGYVDQPPLIAVVVKLVQLTLGDSLPALRFLPALAGAVLVFLTGMLARELGGGGFAQGLAALCVLAAPGLLGIDGFLSMNAFEPLFWMGFAYLLIRIVNGTCRRFTWPAIGVLCGMGLENKYSILIFGGGIVLGLLLTPDRQVFRRPGIWIAGAIALALFLPNLIWNIQHHFPFLELQANIRQGNRNVELRPLKFFGETTLDLLPLTLPVWLAGLWFFLTHSRYRALGWACVFTAAIIVGVNPRIYYLFPLFPLLFAGGAVQWETWSGAWKRTRVIYAAATLAAGAVLAPLAIALLPVETYIRYAKALHMQQPAIENKELGPLPQIFADQFGWEEMAAAVARVYNALPAEVRAKTAIFGQNYGQAGAIDFFGPKYGLPQAISGHQNYFLWGPRGYTGESMIVMDDRPETLARIFEHVEKVARVEHPYSMPYQHFDVYYCSGPKLTIEELWPKIKHWS